MEEYDAKFFQLYQSALGGFASHLSDPNKVADLAHKAATKGMEKLKFDAIARTSTLADEKAA